MLGNLKNPPEPFADIIQTHFKLKARSISTQLDDWLHRDDGRNTSPDGGVYNGPHKNDNAGPGSSGNGFAKDVEEMQKLLKKL
jgi:hypothetical protein